MPQDSLGLRMLSCRQSVGAPTRDWAVRENAGMTEPHGPLHGVKVVACSTAQAGTVPYMLMADLGADVIKVEVPGIGDNSRSSTVMPGFPAPISKPTIAA